MIKNVKSTILVDNYVFGINGALAEHGWSVFLESDAGKFLIDTGAGKAIINNLQVLEVDIKTIDGIILSHHHHDHTGGLLEVLNYLKRPVNVYAHTDLFKSSYSTKSNQHSGIPFRREVLESKGAQFVFNSEPIEIVPDIFLTGEIPRLSIHEQGEQNQVINENDHIKKDKIMDDQSIVLCSEGGLFIILGCAHAGVINTIHHCVNITGVDTIHTIMGGTHLGAADCKEQDTSIRELLNMNIPRIAVSHCTGFDPSVKIKNTVGDSFVFCSVGKSLEI